VKLSPIRGHVFVELMDHAALAQSSIVLPDSVSKAEFYGGQIAGVGAEVADVQLGTYALFKPRSGDVFSIAGRQFAAVHERDLTSTMDEATFKLIRPANP